MIKKKKLTQAAAAKIMGINQPKVSALMRRKLDGFSVERLIHFLNTLGQDIDIIVRPKPQNRKQAIINVYYENRSHCSKIPLAAKKSLLIFDNAIIDFYSSIKRCASRY